MANKIQSPIVGYITLFVALCALGIGVYSVLNTPKLGYISSERLFDEFAYTKELQKDFQKLEALKKSQLDSLRLDIELKASQLQSSKNKADQDKLAMFEQQYLLKERQFREDYEATAQEYRDKVWKRLSKYLKEYGDENSYNIIFGANGQGEIMHASDAEDLTDEIIEYSNNRYQDKD